MRKNFYLSSLLVSCFLLVSAVVRGASVPITMSNPANDTVCSGSAAWFIFVTNDTSASPATIATSWLVSADGGISWTPVTAGGAYTLYSDSLKVTSSFAMNGYWFRAIATNTSGADTSLAAILAVDSSNHGPVFGPSVVCVGAHITLTDPGSRGVWSATNDSAIISSAGIVTGVFSKIDSSGVDTAGIDTIYYTINNTCISDLVDTFVIAINPLPATGVITGASIVCKGATIALADTVSGGVWTVLHPAIDSVSSAGGVVGGLAQGFDTVVYTTTTGLCNASVTHAVRVDTFVTALPITGPTTTCVGNSIDLMNGNVLGTWVWSATNTRASILPTGVATGVSYGLDTFKYVFTNACNTVTSTTAPTQIDTPLFPGVISGAAGVCAGSWIHLTESIIGGIWLSSSSSLAIVDGSGNVTGVAQGTPVISYLVENGCGDFAATHTVSVNIPATAITGIDSVGIDSAIILSDGTVGGAWSSSDGSIAIISSTTGVVTGVGAGIATITYMVTNTCGTTYATMTLYVGPPPSAGLITGNDSVCLGLTDNLSDSVTGGVWVSGNDTIASVSSSGVVTGNAYGLVNISYTVHNAFGYNTTVTSVFVNEPPVVAVSGPSIIALGGDYFLLGAPAGGGWSSSNTTMGAFVVNAAPLTDTVIDSVRYPYVTYGSFVVTYFGSDTLTYTVGNTCGTRSKSFIISLAVPNDHTPVITDKNASLNIYPNPNSGEFTMNLVSGGTEDVTVTITNILGEKVRELTISTNKNYDIKFDQPNGIYLITATTADGSKYNSKIMVTN